MATDNGRVALSFFGMHVQGYARNGAWPSVPFGSIRLWDSGTTWADLEPEPGKWDFRTLDAYVNKAQEASVSVLLTLGQTPTWAASDPETKSAYGAGASSPPRRLEDWDRYVRKVAERYKGRIRYWEIWNEYDVKTFYSGSLKTLANMECRAAKILKHVDGKNMVLSPSDQGGDYRALKRYFEAGGAQCADIISYHFYAPKGKPEDMLIRVSNVRALMRKYGQAEKPLWNTETGWLIEDTSGDFSFPLRPAWRDWRRVHGTLAAGLVLRALALMLNQGIGAFYWYAWDSWAFGLAEAHGRKPKEAAEGYRRAVEWLVGTYPKGCHEDRGIWDCVFVKDDTDFHLVWSVRGHRSYHLHPGFGQASVTDLHGDITHLQSGARDFPVGPVPKLLQNTAKHREAR